MPPAFDRCVKKVKAKGGAGNAYAICRASMGTDAEIMKKAKKKKKGY
jgi:hypothetical protein